MSAIASFTRIAQVDLEGLRDAAVPRKNWRGRATDEYPAYLAAHGTEVATYAWSGYVLATLLPFLQEQGIDLMESEYDDLATHISSERRISCFILTEPHRAAYLEKLAPDGFTVDALRDYYNEFNECSDPEAGLPMLEGIAALRQSLESLDDQSVVVVAIG